MVLLRATLCRTFALVSLILFSCQTIFASPSSSTQISPSTLPPNIVVIMTDDQAFSQLQYLSRSLSFLKGKGLSFNNSYSNFPLCCPSRSTFFTGLNANHHGIFFNSPTSADRFDGGAISFYTRGLEDSTIATLLKAKGYTTSFFGKYLNGYHRLPLGHVAPGWDEWHVFYGVVNGGYYNYSLAERVWPDTGDAVLHSFGEEEENYATDKLARQAVQFIATAPKPFMVYYAPHASHFPAIPPLRYRDSFPGLGAPRTPNYNEADVSDKPQWVKDLRWNPRREQKVDAFYGNGARTLLAVDDAIKSIFQAVQSRGQLKNTVFILTTDNGFSFGSHRWGPKQCPYQECLRTAIFIYYPPLIPEAREVPELVSNVDLYPTIAELAGAPQTGGDGLSLVPLFSSTHENWPRTAVLSQGKRDDSSSEECAPDDTCSIPTFNTLTEREWKYTEYETGEKELYNLLADPYELENLASKPLYSTTLSRLHDQLNQIKSE